MRIGLHLIMIMAIIAVPAAMAHAELPPAGTATENLSLSERQSIAKQLLGRIAKKFADTDRALEQKKDPAAAQLANIADGEELLLGLRLKNNLTLETPVIGRVEGKKLLLSFRDLLLALELPIEMDADTKTAKGWFIREGNKFSLDMNGRVAQSPYGTFPFSDSVEVEENDVYVPTAELGAWFGIELTPNIGNLDLLVKTSMPFPVEERLARKQFRGGGQKIGGPLHPRLKDEAAPRDYPLVDVSTQTSYTKAGEKNDSEEGFAGSAFIRTSGDIAGGTLTTQSALDHKEKLTNVRATFSQQSENNDLLGPLQARRFEIGDVNVPVVPLRIQTPSGLGTRVTNVDPLRNTLRASTEIRGTAFPGWDVELYRDEQLVSVQTVGSDGVYLFEDVDLYSNENNFRVVMYGLQGEMREEDIPIPVDPRRLSSDKGVYDVAVLAQQKQTYRKRLTDRKDEDEGAPALTAVYELPVGERSAVSAAFETSSNGGKKVYVGHAGASTSLGGTLLNFDTAIDQDNEMAAQLVARRDLGKHKLRNELRVMSEKYALPEDSTAGNDVVSNRLNLSGPLLYDWEMRPRYNIGLGHAIDGDGNLKQSYNATLSANVLKRLNLNQQLGYTTKQGDPDDSLDSITTLTGTLGKNRLRLTANYELMPENKLESLLADYRRPLADDLDFNLNVQHRPNSDFTEGRAQIDWRAGFADISPSLSYNSDKEMIAMLNTRFGLARDPLSADIKSFDTGLTANGGVSVFVFLDKNGDNIFNEGDEPLPDVQVDAPQNGGSELTDKDGRVFFTRLLNMRPTDIFVQNESLPDPFWISGYEGFSIIPREGHITTVEFPIHVSGEIDGTVYGKTRDGKSIALRGISVSLYNLKGKKIKTVISESDGFYLIDKVPPGRYLLAIDNKSFDRKYARPKPQPVLIKSNGNTLYGNNIYLHEGGADVQVTFYPDAASLKIDPSTLHGRGLFLNLGTYKSRLSMGIAWLKIRNLFKNELKDMEILEMPSASLPDQKAEAYVLRVLSYSDDMSEVFNKCKVLKANGQACAVDVIPENPPETVALKDNEKSLAR